MLKITKGLRPFVESGITLYADDKGDEYVRVKMDGEDFCIALHDYSKGDEDTFTWDDAMERLEAEEMTTFTKEQAKICLKHLKEINTKFEEIGGEPLAQDRYWTSTESDIIRQWAGRLVWVYNGEDGHLKKLSRLSQFMIRPIINL